MRSTNHILAGAILLAVAAFIASHAILKSLLAAEDWWTSFREMSGQTLFLMVALAALGIFVLLRGLRMAPKEPPASPP